LTKAVTSLGSSISGIDMTMPKLDKGSGSRNLHMSGKKLSPERRATLGVMGVTGLAGLGLGGASGIGIDIGVSEAGSILDNALETDRASPALKLGTSAYKLGQAIKSKDVLGMVEEGANIINTTSSEIDKKLTNENK